MSDQWSSLGTPVRYVRWHWPDDGVWAYDEVDDDGWCLRHIEIRGDGRTVAAASLAEVIKARDEGGTDAVIAYESRYGVAPEAPIPPDATGYSLGPVTREEFERLWAAGRADLEANRNRDD